jgi:hypothetical protein
MPSSISTVRCVGLPSSSTGQRAAPVGEGAVIDHGDAFCRDTLADAPGKGRTALAVEVAFESMADGFVQQDAGPAGAQHHGHFAGRGGPGGEVDAGLMHGTFRIVPQHGVGEVGIVKASAAAGRSLFAPPSGANPVLHDHGDRNAHQRPHVGRHAAVGARHQDHFPGAGDVGHDFPDPRVGGARHGFEAFQQFHLGGIVEGGDRIVCGV